jgi:dTDP-4-dehydrorhamnose reductase
MKIIVTGASGQVGKEIILLCEQENLECIPLNSSTDITNKEALRSVFSSIQNIDFVVNCAAYTAVDKAEDEPEKAYAVNATGVENLAVLCKEFDVPLIHLSTDFVFSGEKASAYCETDIPNSVNVYGKSKYEGEKVLQKIWQKHLILRVSWVFGKYGNNFVKTILRLATERETLNVVGDQKGCPTAAEDIARVVIELIQKMQSGNQLWGIYHYVGEPVTTWYDFALEIVSLLQEKQNISLKKLNKVTSEEYVTKAKRPKNSELLVEKITSDYGIKRKGWISFLRQNFK